MTSLRPVSRRVHVRAANKVKGVLRENYLRNDLKCGAQLCFEGCGGGKLPAEATHYLLPLEDVAGDFLDVLAAPELRHTGVILLQSVVAAVQKDSQRRYRRICSLVKDSDSSVFFFPNEFSADCYVQRESGESAADYSARSGYAAATWYYEHLGGQKPLVMLTEDTSIAAKYGSKRLEVFAVKLVDYLDKFWPGVQSLRSLYVGLADARQAGGARRGPTDFVEYLRADILEAGVKRGKFIKGRLEVNKHHSQQVRVSRERIVHDCIHITGGVRVAVVVRVCVGEARAGRRGRVDRRPGQP